jgi:glycosyltransferase involved in cell wall biosynthesis
MTVDTILRSNQLSAVSPYVSFRARRWTHDPIPVIPNPLPEEGILPARRARVSGRASLVAINNGFTPYKNVHNLLKAFPAIRASSPNATLRLIGREMEISGPAWRWANQRDLTGGVEFVGPIPGDEIHAALDASDLLVHPSLLEACPMVVIDAMSRSVPVVGGRSSGGVPWVLDDGRSGLLVDVRSPSAIASAVTQLLQDDDKWHRLADEALESVRLRCSAATVVGQYEALLADAPPAPRPRWRKARR